nr:unnamed protein product [Amyelois transitella]
MLKLVNFPDIFIQCAGCYCDEHSHRLDGVHLLAVGSPGQEGEENASTRPLSADDLMATPRTSFSLRRRYTAIHWANPGDSQFPFTSRTRISASLFIHPFGDRDARGAGVDAAAAAAKAVLTAAEAAVAVVTALAAAEVAAAAASAAEEVAAVVAVVTVVVTAAVTAAATWDVAAVVVVAVLTFISAAAASAAVRSAATAAAETAAAGA